jgi:hypothetical protein
MERAHEIQIAGDRRKVVPVPSMATKSAVASTICHCYLALKIRDAYARQDMGVFRG